MGGNLTATIEQEKALWSCVLFLFLFFFVCPSVCARKDVFYPVTKKQKTKKTAGNPQCNINIRLGCDQAYLRTGSDEEDGEKSGESTVMKTMEFGELEIPEQTKSLLTTQMVWMERGTSSASLSCAPQQSRKEERSCGAAGRS